MEDQQDYKLFDLMKYTNSYNLGWRFSRYEKSKRMIHVLQNIAKFNQGDSFAEGLIQGFAAGLSKNPDRQNRSSELDLIFNAQEQEKSKGDQER